MLIELYTFDIESGAIKKIEVDDDTNNYNYEYRGGTPGYKLNDNEYYDYGCNCGCDYITVRRMAYAHEAAYVIIR